MEKEQLKILAIDDMPANLALLGLALQDDYAIQIATSGAKGLELAREDPPALILLDIMMPEMDGYETCRRLKAEPLLRDIPVIFVTALAEMNAEAKGFALGAADYLTKPINIEIARLRIRNLLEREQMRRELLQKEAAQRLAASVFAHTHDGIVITDAENRIIDVNASFTRITGYDREEVLGKNPRLLKSGRQPAEFYRNLWHSLLTHDHWNGEIWNRNKSGEVYAALTSISVVRDDQGRIHHFIGLFADITPIKNHEHDLERIAHFDPLTGIPNRVLLADRLIQAIAHTRRSDTKMAVCYLDLDGFKPVNDQFGHEVGDLLLIEIAKRIKDCLRAGDTVARIGGDEFVLLLLDLNELRECENVLDRMLCKVAEPADIAGSSVTVSASLGFTLCPNDSDDADTLLRHADQAMYVAKQTGKNRYHLFDRDIDRIVSAKNETLARIETALRNQEFVLYYQPRVNMRFGEVLAAEALLRWRHPERGILPPSEFLSIVEGTDLMMELGDWVLGAALRQLQYWQDRGLKIAVSVKIAPLHLLREDFTKILKKNLTAFPKLRPEHIELAILETATLQDIGRVSAVMAECKRLGVGLVLDHFGTGYSSLTYLKALPFEALKIDRSFVRDMLRDAENRAIVEGIVNLTGTFHRQVIAEGVETVEHGYLLLKMGCERAQGYGIAPPMPADDFLEWTFNWRPHPAWLNR